MYTWYKVFLISVVVTNYSLNMELEEADPSKYTFPQIGKCIGGPSTSWPHSSYIGRIFFGQWLAIKKIHRYQPLHTLSPYKIGKAIDQQCETNECTQEGELFLNDWYNFSLCAKENSH